MIFEDKKTKQLVIMQRNSFPLDNLNNILSLNQYSFSSKDYKENPL